jgi:hypothetical protein
MAIFREFSVCWPKSGIDGGVSFTASFSVEEARAHLACIRSRSSFRLLAAIVDGEIAGTYSLLSWTSWANGERGPALWKMWPLRPGAKGRALGAP